MQLSDETKQTLNDFNNKLIDNTNEIIALVYTAKDLNQSDFIFCCVSEITIKYVQKILGKIVECKKFDIKIKQLNKLYNKSYGDLCYIKALLSLLYKNSEYPSNYLFKIAKRVERDIKKNLDECLLLLE